MNDTWDKVMGLQDKDDMRQGISNTLNRDDCETIFGTIDFFGGNYNQDYFDLAPDAKPFAPRFRVFDWLAMRIQGRHSGSVGDEQATKVLAHSFIKSDGVTSKFIQDLRETDYDMDHSWETVELVP